jgi:hypothetical protein
MTRHALLAPIAAALLAAGACSPPDTPATRSTPAATMPTPAPPVFVHVQIPEEARPEVEAWAEAMRAAVTAGHGDLKLFASPEEPAVVVRIDTVETGVKADPEPEGEGETSVMRGALVLGEHSRDFSLAYRGEVRPQAEALARNLRVYAAEAEVGEPDAPEPGTDPGTSEQLEPEPETTE